MSEMWIQMHEPGGMEVRHPGFEEKFSYGLLADAEAEIFKDGKLYLGSARYGHVVYTVRKLEPGYLVAELTGDYRVDPDS